MRPGASLQLFVSPFGMREDEALGVGTATDPFVCVVIADFGSTRVPAKTK